MSRIWSLSDLHLSFGVPNKKMDVFGENWAAHDEKMETAWKEVVGEEDLVLIAGDISWALRLEDAASDLEWIDRLPGHKVMIRGNHDLWWKSASKVRKVLPPSIEIIHNDAVKWKDIAIGGTRLWETPDINYGPYIHFRKTEGINVHQKEDSEKERAHDRKIYQNELDRLSWSLDAMDKDAKHRILMVHYPPINVEREENAFSRLIADEGIDLVIYGHLHNLHDDAPVNFEMGGTRYLCTAADHLHFKPVEILL